MEIDFIETASGVALFTYGVYMMLKRKYDVGDPDDQMKVKYTVRGVDAVIFGAVIAGIGAYFVAHSAHWI